MKCVAMIVAALLLQPASHRPPPRKIDVAPGIHVFLTAPYGDAGLDGNSIAILSPEGVLVFDSNGTPAAASAVLAEIRAMTTQPVRYVVHSHWHWDHWYGAEVYKQAYPGVQIVSHQTTRGMMMGPALEFNRPGIEKGLPSYIASLEKKGLTDQAEDARFFLQQKANVHHVFPDVTFTDRLTIHLGGREIQVLHYDRAVTPGDAFLYLPQEKIVVAGDLLVNPVSYALSSYPTGWLRTLERIDTLDASIIVPGHGEPLRDKALLHATMNVMRELLRQGKQAKARGLTADEAKAAILPGLQPLMVSVTRDDAALNNAFRVYFVDWYLHRVYDELNGPLTDAIAAIPPA